ncbi:MAG: hypothetical protein CMJ32_00105 [Phycisphaerae bacterium]|nr:hypothetical protein [Phycisphaerae bacterium]
MIILGIDPGKKGALALLHPERRVECFDMPGTTRELHDLVAGFPLIRMAYLEKLHAGPVMGVKTIGVMFEAYGVLKGALQWRDIPFTEVRPNKWKPALNLSKDKNASREMAMQMFPDQADLFKRVKDDGRAEAVLIAAYGIGLKMEAATE